MLVTAELLKCKLYVLTYIVATKPILLTEVCSASRACEYNRLLKGHNTFLHFRLTVV